MTVSVDTSRVAYATNGTTGPFTVPFYFLDNTHLRVVYTAGGVDTVLTLTTDYTVTGAGVEAGGAITTIASYAAGGTLTIIRSVPLTQLTDYQDLDAFPAASHERALDKITMILQQLAEYLDRVPALPASSDLSDIEFPLPGAGYYIRWNSTGTALEAVSTVEDSGNFTLAATGAVQRSVIAKLGDRPTVEDFGAIGDCNGTTSGSGTDDTAALTAAILWAKSNNRSVHMTPGKCYRVTARLDMYLLAGSGSWGLVCDGWRQASIMGDFSGVDDAVLWARNATLRTACPELRNIRVVYPTGATRCPKALDIGGGTDLKLRGFSVGNSDNTAIRLTTMYNSDCDDVVSYYAGKQWLYKAATGITFSITSGLTTLTASASHFVAGDVGHTLILDDSVSGRSEIFTVSAYTSATQVTVSRASNRTYSAVGGVWEHARCAMSSASGVLTADANVFSANDVGRTLYVQGAGASGAILVGKIASYSAANQVTLDTNASTTITAGYFTCPGVALDSSSTYGGNTNDLTLSNLQVENPEGVALVCVGQSRLFMPMAKLHCDAAPTDTNSSIANLWLSGSDGYMDGVLEGNGINRQGKVYHAAGDGVWVFGKLDVVLSESDAICFEEQNGTDGYVQFGNINVINNVASATRSGIFRNTDPASPRIAMLGMLNTLDLTTQEPPLVAPGNTFTGWYEYVASYGASMALTFATPGDLSVVYSTRNVSYVRVGRQVTIRGNLVTSTFTHTTASGNAQITGLPYAAVGDSVGILSLNNGTSLSGSLQVLVANGSTTMTLQHNQTGTVASLTTANLLTATNKTVRFELTYHI